MVSSALENGGLYQCQPGLGIMIIGGAHTGSVCPFLHLKAAHENIRVSYPNSLFLIS